MHQSPGRVPWLQARAGRWAARCLLPQGPPVLVLSLPRSGSSWTGEALGAAANALYLREPVTQSDSTFYYLGTVFPLDRPDIEQKYRRLADLAYAGWPDFGDDVVRFPDQWRLRDRRRRRVVIKEVNPLACSWYIQHYRPRVVLLVRHPAAVALSWQSKGWLEPNEDSWAENGRAQGRALQAAVRPSGAYPAIRQALYEDLCSDPLAHFERLAEFAGLTWDGAARDFLTARIARTDQSNPHDTSRDTRQMIHGWRRNAVQAHVHALGRTFREFDLPWYRADDDWVV